MLWSSFISNYEKIGKGGGTWDKWYQLGAYYLNINNKYTITFGFYDRFLV